VEQFLQFKKRIGNAMWLLLLLATYSDECDGQWWPVRRGGEFISDARLAVFLGESEATTRKHRKHLEKEGLIRTEPAEMHLHRRFWIRNIDHLQQEQSAEKLSVPASGLVH